MKCDECDCELHPFALPDGRDAWGCDECGFSWDERDTQEMEEMEE